MYMEKLVVGPEVKGMVDLNLPLEQNLRQWHQKWGNYFLNLQ